MTRDEFTEWFAYHCSCFTGVDGWLTKLTTRGDSPLLRRDVLARWYGCLREVDLAAARAASLRMMSGDIEEPKGFDRHPAAIRKACGISRKGAVAEKPWEKERYDPDGNRMYACTTCMDVGLVRCWHPEAMKAAREGRLVERLTLYDCWIACTCAAGLWHWQHNASKEVFRLPKFAAAHWLPLSRIENGVEFVGHVGDPAEQQRLIEWVESGRVQAMPGYEPAFAEFNGPPQKLLAGVGRPEEF